jgi:signal transduction histidine kinase
MNANLFVRPRYLEGQSAVVGPDTASDLLTTAIGGVLLGCLFLAGLAVGSALRARRERRPGTDRFSPHGPLTAALRDDADVEAVLRAAIDAIRAWGLATQVSITVFDSTDGMKRDDRVITETLTPAAGTRQPPNGHDPAPAVTVVPMRAQESLVGLLEVRLRPGAEAANAHAAGELETFAEQLAWAIRHTFRVADLDHRMREWRGLYGLVLEVSAGSVPSASLPALVRHTRNLLAADDAALCLSEAGSQPLHLRGDFLAAVRAEEGPLCLTYEQVWIVNGTCCRATCPMSPGHDGLLLQVPLPGTDGQLGHLCAMRSRRVPFATRDLGYARAVAALAATAIDEIRVHELDRQDAVLAERERIARELHDSLAQALALTHLQLRTLGGRPDVAALTEVASQLRELAMICQRAFNDVREEIFDLQREQRLGLVENLKDYLVEYSRQFGVQTHLDLGQDGQLHLLPRCEAQVFRMVQEALTNVRKHSGASTATVRIRRVVEAIQLTVEDDGCGFDPATASEHGGSFGLQSMRGRMEIVGGSLVVDSSPGTGTRVTATIPPAMIPATPSPGLPRSG